jgi:hypothetical protein
VGEAQEVWDFLGQAESTLVPFGFNPLRSGLRKLVLTSCCLTLLSKEVLVLVMEKHDYSKLCF